MENLGKERLSPYSTVKKLAAELKRGRESIEDDGRSSFPKDATTDENVKIVHTLVMCDMRQDLRSIASEVCISFRAVQSILTATLGMSKVMVRLVLQMVNDDLKKRTRQDISRYLPFPYGDDPRNFIEPVVTPDETWVHHFDPESKMQSKLWKHPGSAPPKKFLKRFHSAGRLMDSIFRDNQGVIMIDILS